MKRAKTVNEPSYITTGNVLEDLGFSAQEIREIEIKHDLWVPIRAEIEARELTQAQLAKALQIHQPDASLLLRGQIERFSIARLLQFAHSLELAVTFTVAPMAGVPRTKGSARLPLRAARPRSKPVGPLSTGTGRRTAVA
jgi:predicted XRE-type DNA-binding protein